jgi:DNA-directed RNA polymerase specialized sigma24 family protein
MQTRCKYAPIPGPPQVCILFFKGFSHPTVVLTEATPTNMTPPESVTRAEWVREALECHEASLLRYALSIAGDPDVARDAVQDTFLRLCEQEPGELHGRLAPWLFTVCRNRLLDVLRKERRMSPLTDVDLETRPSEAPSPAAAAESADSASNVLAPALDREATANAAEKERTHPPPWPARPGRPPAG